MCHQLLQRIPRGIIRDLLIILLCIAENLKKYGKVILFHPQLYTVHWEVEAGLVTETSNSEIKKYLRKKLWRYEVYRVR